MTNPIIRIHNAETDEIIDREMTDKEYAEFQASLLPKPLSDEEQALLDKKLALLDKLGITEDEAKLLLA